MPTVKLVVIGSSGVGKTSLRGKYISGRFSNGYRATIGADFITKTLPHPTKPDESVTLQIWDTAGQERFSSLSTAFFRGADAALLMFDVNSPETMLALKKWWADFCNKTPVHSEADMNDYCCVVVGNKIDMVEKGNNGGGRVSESEALDFLDELVPPSVSSPASIIQVLPPLRSNSSSEPSAASSNSSLHLSASTSNHSPPKLDKMTTSTLSPPVSQSMKSPSIAIASQNGASRGRLVSHSPRRQSHTRSISSSRFYPGTMTTTHTSLTIYHTPSSSVFDVYESARASPEPPSRPDSAELEPPSVRKRSMTMISTNSASSGSAVTITPSLFARERENVNGTQPNSAVSPSSSPALPPLSRHPIPPERGPKLFFTSAKTGEGVSDVFEYIAQRVVRKWEYDEWVDSRAMHFREASGLQQTIRLDVGSKKRWSECC